jgi:ATP-dependent RNA helicase DDX10/DBP4
MLAAELENKDKKGYSGIDIEEAKRMLQNEDKYDKELYRQRIKRMHKEKKEKEKQLRRAKRAKA